MDSKKNNLWLVTILIVFCAAVLNFILAKHNTQLLIEKGLHLNGVPLPCNNDSYFYLDLAYSLAESGAGVTDIFTDPRQSVLLPYLLSFVAGVDKLAMMSIGNYAGPVLGLSMLLAVLPWGVHSRSPVVMVLSSLFALCAPYWLNRTQIGVLDTDSLVPGLCYFALFCVFKFSSLKSKITGWVFTYIFTILFLWFWWRPGALLSTGFICLYLISPRRNRVDACVKYILLLALLGVVGMALAGYSPFAKYLAYVAAHAKLAFGGMNGSLISDSIVELNRIGLWEMFRKSLVFPVLIFSAVYGLFCYARNLRSQSVFLGSALFFGVTACISQRFIPLFIPAVSFFAAYGLASFCSFVCERGLNVIPSLRNVRNHVQILCCACILLLSLPSVYNHDPESYFGPEDFVLAKLIRKNTPADSLVWTWWDYGYFFKFLTGREVFFDGGTQSETTCFIAAYPLIQPDMDVAASWMKYFSTGTIREKETYAIGNDLDAILRDIVKTGSTGENTASRPVVLCLPQRVFTAVGYLYSFAHIRDERVPPVLNHLDLFPKKGFTYDVDAQIVQIPEEMVSKGYDSFGAVIDTSGIGVDDLWLDKLADPYLVYSDKTDFIAVTDRSLVESVLIRLLGFFENETDQFYKVFFRHDLGGLWLVR